MNHLIRQLARRCVLDVLGAFATPAPGVHILNGHRTQHLHETPDTFRLLLSSLARDVTFVRFEEAVRLITGRESVDTPVVAFSFDDGFAECYTHYAPVLEERGLNAAFFVNPNFADGDEAYVQHFTEDIVLTPHKHPMRWEEILDLHRRGHVIGAHTMDHYMINDNDAQKLEYQIGECKRVLEGRLGAPCDYFAFPYGRLEHANSLAIDIACRHYPYVFSQSDHKHYFSFGGRVINRRHFEPFWPPGHVRYFLSCHKR